MRAAPGGPGAEPRAHHLSPGRALALVSLAATLANASWFSATAVVPALEREWALSPAAGTWLVIVVQIGFVGGSVGSALLNLPDRLEPRHLIAGAAVAAGLANLALVGSGGLALALPLRFLVGVALAGVYAPAVKLVATYFANRRGLATGVVVGALTLGSGTPNLVRGAVEQSWQATIAVTSLLAVLAAFVIRPVRRGPGAAPSPPLDVGAAIRALVRERSLRLVLLGYLGHMWELYALWAWMASFFVAARTASAGSAPGVTATGIVAFAGVGAAGMVGSVVAGRLADRVGRAAIASGAMLLSSACCLASPFAFTSPTAILVAFLMVWGAAAVADSAQFSAAVTELADRRYAGSILTLQLGLGFVLTVASIRLVPLAAGAVGWRLALVPLSVGPLLGAIAMLRLRGSRPSRGACNAGPRAPQESPTQ